MGPETRSIGVITQPGAGQEIGAVGYRHLDGAPRAVARSVRGLITEAVNFAEVVDDLVIDAVEVFHFLSGVVKPAALFGQQGQGLARVLVGARGDYPRNAPYLGVEVDWNNHR